MVKRESWRRRRSRRWVEEGGWRVRAVAREVN